MDEMTLDLLDDCVESFELALSQDGDTDLRQFLPPPSDPNHAVVAVELMRVDLEQRWRAGSPRPLQEYRELFREVLSQPDRLASLAFEEYRCRVHAGESTDPGEYRRRFDVMTGDWPEPSSLKTNPNDVETVELIGQLGPDTNRIVDSIQLFPKVGDQFAGFQLTGQIGQGTFGTVFLAQEDDLAGRRVVLKVSADTSLEPQHLARLQHTNIVPIYSLRRAGKLRAVCMPFFGRTNLMHLLKELQALDRLPKSGQFFANVIEDRREPRRDESDQAVESRGNQPLREISNCSYVDACLRLLQPLADGLEHAHQRGILHRDIKPANVLVTDEGRPMLLDFNISDELVLGGTSCLMVGGTLPYMSPEQRRAMSTGAAIDQRSDVYSFGVLCHELLCGQLPAADQSQVEFGPVGPQVRVKASSIRQLNDEIPSSVAAIVARCLDPDRERRYQSMGDVHEDLQRHLDNRPLRHAADRDPIERIRKWCRRHPRLLSATSVSLMALIAVLILTCTMAVAVRRSRHYEAVSAVDALSQQLPELRVLLSAADQDQVTVNRGMRQVEDLLAELRLDTDFESDSRVRTLPLDRRHELRDGLAELYYLSAAHYLKRAQQGGGDQAWADANRWHHMASAIYSGGELPIGLRLQSAALHDTEVVPAWIEVPAGVRWDSNPRRMIFAQELIRRGHYDRAVHELESIRQEHPLDFSTWFLLGNSYVALDRPEEAEGCFTTCVTLWGDSYPAWFHRGLCRLEAGQFTAAEQDFDHVLKLQGNFAPALFNRALCRKSQRDFEGAVADLNDVLRLEGEFPRTLLVRARVFELMGDDQRAQADRQLAFTTKPRDVKGWLARGLAQVETDPQRALVDLRQAQRIAPGQRDVQRNLAYVLGEHLEATEDAAGLLAELYDQFGNAEDLIAHGVMLARLGRRDQAVRAGQTALAQQRSPRLAFQAACIYAINSDRFPEDAAVAVGLLAESISREPQWLAQVASDADLDKIRDLPQLRSVIRSAHSLYRAVRLGQPAYEHETSKGQTTPAAEK